jgi:hypothetical protein
MTDMNARYLVLALGLAVLAGCTPKRINEEPILRTGDRVPGAEVAVANAAAQADEARGEAARRDSLAAAALADCAPAVCAAIARGEVALGMTEPQVLAATRTTERAWSARRAGAAAVLVPAAQATAPRDVMGELAMIQLDAGRVRAYSYREAQGVRVVTTADEAGTAGRAAALAEMLIREGDDLAARGDMAGALDRYDRADVLTVADPMLQYRIASLLDKQLRPLEALMRYQLFLHRMELERIEAQGDAYAKMAAAMAHARERIIVLERHGR